MGGLQLWPPADLSAAAFGPPVGFGLPPTRLLRPPTPQMISSWALARHLPRYLIDTRGKQPDQAERLPRGQFRLDASPSKLEGRAGGGAAERGVGRGRGAQGDELIGRQPRQVQNQLLCQVRTLLH